MIQKTIIFFEKKIINNNLFYSKEIRKFAGGFFYKVWKREIKRN